MALLPGKELAQELIGASRATDGTTPIAAVVAAARNAALDEPAITRMIGRLWTLERMFYYIYGGWGQGLEINDFPPSVKYLFSKQILDESTHEMLYLDTLIRRGAVATQREAFQQPYGRFAVDSALAYYVFSLRNLATYPHAIRIAALNLGPKIIEFEWMTQLAEATSDPDLKAVFDSQTIENRSHINMGRRIVEESIDKPVDAELCRWACSVARRDYGRFLHELGDFVLDRETPAPPLPRIQVTD